MLPEAFLLSVIAGSATGIGGLIVILMRKVSNRFIAASMGFASGVCFLSHFLIYFMKR
jgi:zinc transporter ZupT